MISNIDEPIWFSGIIEGSAENNFTEETFNEPKGFKIEADLYFQYWCRL